MATQDLPVLYLEKQAKTEQCKVCKGDGSGIRTYFVTLQDINRAGDSGCQLCRLVVLSILEAMGWDHPLLIVFVGLNINLAKISIHIISEKYRKSPEKQTMKKGINVFDDIELFTPFGTNGCSYPFVPIGRDIARTGQAAYLPVLAEWLQRCRDEHPSCTSLETPLPSRVVDVGTDASTNVSLYLSRGESVPYAALSHCWGKAGTLRTTRENWHLRMQAIPFTELPQTFKDAVIVTRSLGIRYLWIDSLCIVQDDKEDWEAESTKMSAIYSNAYLVIGADISKDSNGGFLKSERVVLESCRIASVENNDGSRSEVHTRTRQKHGYLCSPFQPPSTPLAHRAWTLQEQLLSSKMVHFANEELFWECRTAMYCECMELDNPLIPQDKLELKISLESEASHDQFRSWQRIVGVYETRSLTFASDFLPALSGIASHMQKFGAGEYLAGIWKDNLLEELLWFASSSYMTSWQRMEPYRAPTWSWASVKRNNGWGTIKFFCEDRALEAVYVQVLGVHCTPSGKDPNGAIASGHLTLAARLLPAIVKKWRPESNYYLYFSGKESAGDICPYIDIELELGQGGSLYCLLFGRFKRTPYGEDHIGLVLRKLTDGEDTYERVGICKMNRGGKKMFELVQDTIITVL